MMYEIKDLPSSFERLADMYRIKSTSESDPEMTGFYRGRSHAYSVCADLLREALKNEKESR